MINDSELTEDEKVSNYNQTLTKFQRLYARNDKNPRALVSSEKQEEIRPKLWGLPPQYKNKAKNLLDYLLSRDDIKFSSNGSVTIKGESIADSSISDLIHKAIAPRSKLTSLEGWSEFAKYLQDANAPKSIFSGELKNFSKSESAIPRLIKRKAVKGVKTDVKHNLGKRKRKGEHEWLNF